MAVTTSYPPQTVQGIVTSFLPLTTTFSPQAGCSKSFQLGADGSLVAYDPRYGLSVDSSVKCQPSAAVQSYQTPQVLDGGVLVQRSIMPMICPSGWKTLVSSVRDQTSTLAMCCPSGYYLEDSKSGFVVGDCASTVTSGATLTYASTPNDEVKSWAIKSLVVKELTTIKASGVIGWNIGSPNTSPSTPATSDPSPASSTPSNTSTDTSLPLAKAASSGLSTGARAGIGVAAAVVGIGLIALVIMYLMRRGRKPVPPPHDPVPITLPPDAIKEEPWTPTHEIEGRNRGHELQAQTTGYELQGERGAEMLGEPRLPPYEPPAELP